MAGYLLILISIFILKYYFYQGICATKSWIIEFWKQLYGYMKSHFNLLDTYYDFVLTILSQLAGFSAK
jgi:hypothetical protein